MIPEYLRLSRFDGIIELQGGVTSDKVSGLGELAQLVERRVRNAEARGSNPLLSRL